MHIAQYKFGGALINSIGKQLFHIRMFLKKHVFSDAKHNTTKLPTIDECRYYSIRQKKHKHSIY